MGHQPPARGDHQRRQAGRALGIHGLHALHRRAMSGGLSGELLLHHRRRRGAALQGPLHRLRLLLLRLSVRRSAVSQGRQLRVAREDGQVHLLRRRTGGRWLACGVREVRRQPSGGRQVAALRGDVLDQVAVGRRRRDYRADLQGARGQARLWLRRLGLEDGLSRDDRVVSESRHADVDQLGGTCMATHLTRIRFFLGALALAFIIALAAPVNAQQRNPDDSVNPTASAVHESQLLNELSRISGRCSLPDQKACTIEQPAGRDWRHFHQVTLRWIGAILIIGILAVLVVFYLWRGMVRIESGRSGRTIVRFNAFERFVHWMTATCFIILAVSGLNITFGRPLLLPLIGFEAFSEWSQWAKYAHNYLSFPFTIGVVLIFLIWIAGNIPNKVDVDLLRRGGAMIGHDPPPPYRFNAGQKAIYWIVVVGGAAVAVTGYELMFPFYLSGIEGMQVAQIVHSIVAVLFIAAMLAHIYIGTIGMEGAFEAMGSGTVDINWAREHHSLWLEEENAGAGVNEARPRATAGARRVGRT